MPEPKIEFRRVELRRVGESRAVEGTVVRYGDIADIAGVFRETFEAGSLTIRDATLNVQHERSMIVARQGAGLEFEDGRESLTMKAELANTRVADDALEAIDAGLFRGLSMEFIVERETWDESETPLRTVSAAELRGVGIVDTPAYPASQLAEARSLLASAQSFAQPDRTRRWML